MDTFVVPTPSRRVDVTGADRVRYLEDVTSQHLVDVPVTHVRSALYLDTHGAPLAMFDVVTLGDRLVLIVPDEGVVATAVEVLGGRTFLLDVRFEATDHEVIAVRGPDAKATVAAAGLTAVAGRRPGAGDLLIVARDQGIDVVGPPSAIGDAVAALTEAGAREGDADDLEGWRIAAGVPAWGREVVAPHLPEEVGLLPTHVHLAKGCYPGQEAVARMWMLGRPRRRLAVVATRGELAPGWQAGSGRRTATVTSVAPGGGHALAFVPADAAVGDVFGDGGDESDTAQHQEAIEVQLVVGATTSPPGADPAVLRRRDRQRA
jgi:folate-binding protein YgfZ